MKNKALMTAVKRNVSKGAIRENLELIKVLKTDTLFEFFRDLEDYKNVDDDFKSFSIVDDILESYGIECDSRMNEFYYNLVKVSRIINKRTEVTEQDYDLLRFIIEKTNCKIDIKETTEYAISGPPDIKKEKEDEMRIEEHSTTNDDMFGMPSGEF